MDDLTQVASRHVDEKSVVGKVMADVLARWGVQLLSDKISDVLASAVEEIFHNLSSQTLPHLT
jgi:hypothetical protein